MRHLRLLTLSLIAVLLGLLALTGSALAQGGPQGDYQGAPECRSCHSGLSRDHATSLHASTLMAADAEATRVVADFGAGEDLRTVQLPGETAPRPFTLEDVAYVLGAGRYAQRFVVTGEDGTLFVLPAEWNAAEGVWQPFALAETWPDPAYDFVQNCAYCHTTGLDRESGQWVDSGVQCEACHGPGENHITLADESGIRPNTAELAEIRGAIYNQHDPQVCGQCHGSGRAPDGRPYPLGYQPGGALLDAAVYSLSTPESDATHWWASGHAGDVAMQFNEWVASPHAALPSALASEDNAGDECLRCHSGDYRYVERVRGWFANGELDGDPPEAVTLATASTGIACQTCHNPHSEEERPFLLADEPYALCVDCHSNRGIEGYVHHPNYEMFEGLSLTAEITGFPSAHFSAEDGPDCVQCHMPRLPVAEGARASHSLIVVLPGAPEPLEAAAGCSACHTDVTPKHFGDLLTVSQEDTETRLAAADAALTDDTPAWVRVALDMVRGDGSNSLHNYSYTQALLNSAEAELGLVTQHVAPGVTALSPWVTLPVLGVVPGLTQPALIAIVAVTALAVLVGAVLLLRPGQRRLVGFFVLVGAMAVGTAPWWAFEVPNQQPVISGENSYCMSCHGWDRSLSLMDGAALDLGVDMMAIAESVHGDQTHPGSMGCTDCHGADSFPHRQIPFTQRQYRQAGVSMCAMCHADSMAHHEAVVARNIAVGCVDCHGGHNIQAAGTLLNYTPLQPLQSPLATQEGGG